MTRPLISVVGHLRNNTIAYLALVCSLLALSGGAYAAIDAAAIRNHSIQPVKFDQRLIGGVVRVWAVVAANGRLLSGSPGASSAYNGLPGIYGVQWTRSHAKFQRCAGIASVRSGAYVDGVADVESDADVAAVHTFTPQGVPANRPFSVAIIC